MERYFRPRQAQMLLAGFLMDKWKCIWLWLLVLQAGQLSVTGLRKGASAASPNGSYRPALATQSCAMPM
jgi:hypothetical protein